MNKQTTLPHADTPDLCIGIDMGGTNIRAAIMTSTGHIHRSIKSPLPKDLRERVTEPIAMIRSLTAEPLPVGMAVAGLVASGRLLHSVNIGLNNVNFAEIIRAETGSAAVIVNDAQAAAFGEARMEPAGTDGLSLMITVGTGIGGGIVQDGRLLTGLGHAGEVGHMSADPRGRPCGCGSRGCWETTASGSALARSAGEVFGTGTAGDVTTLADLATAGDRQARSAIDTCAQAFARGLNSLAAVLSPDTIILGGGVLARPGFISSAYLAAAEEGIWTRKARIRPARLGDTAGIIGAGMLAGTTLSVPPGNSLLGLANAPKRRSPAGKSGVSVLLPGHFPTPGSQRLK